MNFVFHLTLAWWEMNVVRLQDSDAVCDSVVSSCNEYLMLCNRMCSQLADSCL